MANPRKAPRPGKAKIDRRGIPPSVPDKALYLDWQGRTRINYSALPDKTKKERKETRYRKHGDN